jgi:hypothetical protein
VNRILSSIWLLAIVGLLIIWGTVITLTYALPIEILRPEPTLPEGTPTELLTMPLIDPENLSDGLVIYDNSNPIQVNVTFGDMSSIGGNWYGEEAIILGCTDGEIKCTPTKSEKGWNNTVQGTPWGGDPFTPAFSALLPLNESNNHEKIQIVAKMNVFYPVPAGSLGFVDSSQTKTKNISLIVISPEEAQLREDILDVRLENETMGYVGAGILISLLWVFLSLIIVFIYKAHVRQSNTINYYHYRS